MNFLKAGWTGRDGAAWFEGQGVRLALPADQTGRMSGHAGEAVVLGVRPEHLGLQPAAGVDAAGAAMPLSIQGVDPLGGFMDLRAVTSTGAAVIARTPAEAAAPPIGPMTLYADTRRLHFFAPGSHGVNPAPPAV